MAFQSGSATDLDDLFSKLETFITTHGWTVDRAHNAASPYTKQPAYHKNSCYVQFRYDGTSPGALDPTVGVYQSTGFSATQKSGNHTNDSGSGYYTAGTPTFSLLKSVRCIYECGDGPFEYWFFERDDGGSGVYYVHVVIKVRPNEYRHFGFGLIDKFGDWDTGSGGEYVYGHRMEDDGYSNTVTSFLLDGGTGNANTEGYDSPATMRLVSFPGAEQSVSPWCVIFGNPQYQNSSNRDRANNFRNQAIGGMRLGPFSRAFGIFRGYPGFTGMVPTVPNGLWLAQPQTGIKRLFFIGWHADTRFLNIGDFEDEEEVTIGSDTWVMFPLQKRSNQQGGPTNETSLRGGVAYRKDTT